MPIKQDGVWMSRSADPDRMMEFRWWWFVHIRLLVLGLRGRSLEFSLIPPKELCEDYGRWALRLRHRKVGEIGQSTVFCNPIFYAAFYTPKGGITCQQK